MVCVYGLFDFPGSRAQTNVNSHPRLSSLATLYTCTSSNRRRRAEHAPLLIFFFLCSHHN